MLLTVFTNPPQGVRGKLGEVESLTKEQIVISRGFLSLTQEQVRTRRGSISHPGAGDNFNKDMSIFSLRSR
jgi:hypothetical protein